MDMVTRVQILDKCVCISYCANTQTGLFNLGMEVSLDEGKL